MNTKENQYKTEYDLIRIIAILLVIYNHSGDSGFRVFTTFFDTDLLTVTSWKFWPTLFVSIVCKTAVPLFFMVSGALLLGKQESYKQIFRNRILKYVIVLLVFSAIYYLIERRYTEGGWLGYFKSVYSEGMIIPFWFLYAYISYLLLLPFLRKLVANMEKADYQYLFILVLIFQCTIPLVQFFVFSNSLVKNTNLNVSPIAATVFLYPVLGYGIQKYGLGRIQKVLVILLSILISIPVMAITRDQMAATGLTDEETFSKYFSCCCLLQTTALFTVCCSLTKTGRIFSKPAVIRCVKETAGCVFGIYLIHMLIMNKGWICYDILTGVLPPYLSLWLYIFIVFVLSLIVVYIIKKIPIMNKLL